MKIEIDSLELFGIFKKAGLDDRDSKALIFDILAIQEKKKNPDSPVAAEPRIRINKPVQSQPPAPEVTPVVKRAMPKSQEVEMEDYDDDEDEEDEDMTPVTRVSGKLQNKDFSSFGGDSTQFGRK